MSTLNGNPSQSIHRLDAAEKVTGDALYPGDITPENLLHGKILFSNQPHARLLSINVEKALAVPGVVAIFTAKDVPVNEYGLIMPDQPVLAPEERGRRKLVRRAHFMTIIAAWVITVPAAALMSAAIFYGIRAFAG